MTETTGTMTARDIAGVIADAGLLPGFTRLPEADDNLPLFMHGNAPLGDDQGRAIILEPVYGDAARVEVRGATRTDQGWRSIGAPTIRRVTVALARGPEAIAKEIARRFLPDFTFEVERRRLERARQVERQAKVKAFADEVAATVGALEPSLNFGGDAASVHFYGDDHIHGDVQVYDDSATLKLRLPRELTLKVLRLVNAEIRP